MIGGELERVVVCTKLHPNASFSPPLFGLKKSGKWPKEEWKVAQRRVESGPKKVGKWAKEGWKVAQRRERIGCARWRFMGNYHFFRKKSYDLFVCFRINV